MTKVHCCVTCYSGILFCLSASTISLSLPRVLWLHSILRSKLTAPQNLMSFSQIRYIYQVTHILGLSGVVALTLPIASADRGSRPVYYLPCSDLRQVVNLSLSV